MKVNKPKTQRNRLETKTTRFLMVTDDYNTCKKCHHNRMMYYPSSGNIKCSKCSHPRKYDKMYIKKIDRTLKEQSDKKK